MSIEELYRLFCTATGVSTDSRKIARDSMFFALRGETFDGNDYAVKALESGARYAVVDRPSLDSITSANGGKCLLVEDSLTSLQKMAAYNRLRYDIPVIGITGTNGKTTTKELITAVLSKKYNTVATAGNFNNHIGVPLTLLRIDQHTQIAVVEMGASARGEILALASMANPTCGIVTNVGKAHIQGFGSFDGVKRTKGELYDFLRQKGGEIFYNENNPVLCEMIKTRPGVMGRPFGGERSGYKVVAADAENPFLTIQCPNGHILKTRLIGAYNFDNVMAAITIGLHFNVSEKQIYSAIERYVPSNDRSQLTRTGNNTLIVDTYNANPSSMEAALDNFAGINFEGKSLILGDMRELGEISADEHDRILAKALAITGDIVLVGKEFAAAAKRSRAAADIPAFDTAEDLAVWYKNNPVKNRVILIKGSHSIRLETIPAVL